ncbi:hypothetical protein OCU04_010510 [Sclerotinia nivalis]|uniref:Uncharacterized protein n=1 Tax=Sclerotinia nivalis TaxID=352851 RepID=A0A9X0ACD4_9HELO|nr:hypothetical protein OCU04_010510 [Sclerotinia nivalis]
MTARKIEIYLISIKGLLKSTISSQLSKLSRYNIKNHEVTKSSLQKPEIIKLTHHIYTPHHHEVSPSNNTLLRICNRPTNHYTSQTQIMKEDQNGAPTTPITNILVKIGLMKEEPVHATCVGEFEFCSPMNGIICCDHRICTYCRGDAGGRTICHNNQCTG